MARVGGICIAAAAVARYDRIVARSTARRDTGSALFDSSTGSWGIGEIGDIEPSPPGWTARASAFCSSCRSTRCRRREFPILSPQRDGDRPAVHINGGGRGLRGSRGEASLGRADSRAARRSRGCAGSTTRPSAPSRITRCADRSPISATGSGPVTHAARPRSVRSARSNRGGWTITRLPRAARCIRRANVDRWPAAVRDRDPQALEAARGDLADDVMFRRYLQWLAGDQWGCARPGRHRLAFWRSPVHGERRQR